jgi:hypothetical protein
MAAVEEALQRLDEASSAAHAQGDEDAWSEDEEPGARQPAEARPAAAAGEAAGPIRGLSEGSVGAGGGGGGGSAGELQRVVMSKRLAGLQSRQRELEVSAHPSVATRWKCTKDVRPLLPQVNSATVMDVRPLITVCTETLLFAALQATVQQEEVDAATAGTAAASTGDEQPAPAAAAAPAASKAVQLVEDDVFASAAPRRPARSRGAATRGGSGGLVETERDRLIRTVRENPQGSSCWCRLHQCCPALQSRSLKRILAL